MNNLERMGFSRTYGGYSARTEEVLLTENFRYFMKVRKLMTYKDELYTIPKVIANKLLKIKELK